MIYVYTLQFSKQSKWSNDQNNFINDIGLFKTKSQSYYLIKIVLIIKTIVFYFILRYTTECDKISNVYYYM